MGGSEMRRSIVALTLAGSAVAFSGLAPLVSKTPAIKATSGLRLRHAKTSIKMVDWDWDKKEEEENYSGPGSERGQVNRSDEIGARSEGRLNAAKQRSGELGVLSLLKGLHTHLLYFSARRPEAVLPVKCVASNATD